ncbi:MAG: DUF166 domain-containing protein [Methanotrichaceae archaeon]|nr:DUF166 domain-containing protein [Methanotrichaceae archaeon]
MKLVIFYSGEFGERVAGNLVNYPAFAFHVARPDPSVERLRRT